MKASTNLILLLLAFGVTHCGASEDDSAAAGGTAVTSGSLSDDYVSAMNIVPTKGSGGIGSYVTLLVSPSNVGPQPGVRWVTLTVYDAKTGFVDRQLGGATLWNGSLYAGSVYDVADYDKKMPAIARVAATNAGVQLTPTSEDLTTRLGRSAITLSTDKKKIDKLPVKQELGKEQRAESWDLRSIPAKGECVAVNRVRDTEGKEYLIHLSLEGDWGENDKNGSAWIAAYGADGFAADVAFLDVRVSPSYQPSAYYLSTFGSEPIAQGDIMADSNGVLVYRDDHFQANGHRGIALPERQTTVPLECHILK